MTLKIAKPSLLCVVLFYIFTANPLLVDAIDSLNFSKQIFLRQIKHFGKDSFRLYLLFLDPTKTYYKTKFELKEIVEYEEYYNSTDDYYQFLKKSFQPTRIGYLKPYYSREVAWIDISVFDNENDHLTGYIKDCSELPITEEEHVDFVSTLGIVLNNIDLDKSPWPYLKPNKDPSKKPIPLNPSIEFKRIKVKGHQKICYYPDAFVNVQLLKQHLPFCIPANKPIEDTLLNLRSHDKNLNLRKTAGLPRGIVDRNKSTESESSFDSEDSARINEFRHGITKDAFYPHKE